MDDVTWPNIRPMNLAVAVDLPGGGKVNAKGAVKIEPLDLTLTLNTRDAPIEPYRAYFPFPASFSGRFNSDSQNRVRITNGKLTALSRGNSWATDLAVKAPDGKDAPLRLERMEINGIDFGWPTHARVARVRLKAAGGRARPRGRRVDQRAEAVHARRPSAGRAPRATRLRLAPAKASRRAPATAPAAGNPQAARGCSRRWSSTSRRSWSRTGYMRFLDHTTTAAVLPGHLQADRSR